MLTHPSSPTRPALTLALAWCLAPGCAPTGATDDDLYVADPNDAAAYPNPEDAPARLTTPASGARLDRAEKNAVFFCARAMLPSALLPRLTQIERPWVVDNEVITADIPFVDGAVDWDAEFAITETDTERRLKGNGLPNHPTGTFPVQPGSNAYEYYAALPVAGYANAAEIPIAAYDLDVTLPKNPVVNDEATCIEHILTGVATQTGAAWHVDIALDDKFNLVDPSAALPMDRCWGHPYDTQYHYHGYSWRCMPDQGDSAEHSPLFGYAIDGFGVFGPRGEDGIPVSNADLDECHGHTHVIDWNGTREEMFHYHVNNEYPYSIGCFRGTPIELPSHLKH
jgi:hypothetical protein